MRFSKYALYTNIDTVDWKKKKKLRNGEYSTHSEPHRPALRATYSII